MTHALYFVVPDGRSRLIDEIAGALWTDPTVDRVGCVVESRSDRQFLRSDSDSPYESVDLAPDLSPDAVDDDTVSRSPTPSLDRLRSAYGIPLLTPFVVSDARYDHTSRAACRTLVERAFGYFEEVLDEFDPTVVITPDISRPFEWVPARIATKGGTYLWWKTTRIGSRYGLIVGTHQEEFCDIDDWTEATQAEGEYTTESRQAARDYLTDVREAGSKPDFYARRSDSYGDSPLKLVFPYGLPTLRELGTLFRRRVSKTTDFDDRRLPRAKNVSRRLRTRLNDPFESPQPDDMFVFFPLHAQPEPSTRLNAPLFEDQITLAEQVSRSLPVDCYLYVKDHPRMFRDNTRSPTYYDRLAEIPGVRVLTPNADSHELIKESAAVVSVVGTPAMEAAFFDTPSVVFGPAHFTVLSSVRRCNSLDALPEILSWALSASGCPDAELLSYLSTVFAQTFEVPTDASGSSPDAQRLMAEAVTPELRTQLQTLL
jgi:hypothetical protein